MRRFGLLLDLPLFQTLFNEVIKYFCVNHLRCRVYKCILKWQIPPLLCSSWLLTPNFFWATRSWPSVQRSTSLPPSTSTLTSSTFSSTSWLLWDAPVIEAAPSGEQQGDGECLHLLLNVANMPFLSASFNFFPIVPSLISHTHARTHTQSSVFSARGFAVEEMQHVIKCSWEGALFIHSRSNFAINDES